MIIIEKLDKPYEQVTIRTKVWCRCDYCGREFQRDKKSRERLNAIVAKDSCGDKPCSQTKREDVCLKNFGTKNIFESEQFKNKQKETNLAKYGTEEYFSSADFRQKRKESLGERYGVDSPLRSEEVRKKHEQTCLERYGVANPSQVEEFGEKRAANNLEKYGVESPMQLEEVKQKKRETTKQKYGVDSYTQTEQYWVERKRKCLEKHGVEYESQLPENREKAKQTCMERYGVDSYSKLDEYKEKIEKTCLERYGVTHSSKAEEVQKKCRENCLRKYGVDHPWKAVEVIEKIHATWMAKYGSTNPNMKLKTQPEISDWLKSVVGHEFVSNRKILNGREIDLYNDTLKLGIEFNGLNWHHEMSKAPRLRNYHYDKYAKCLTAGVRLITIFEDEWKHRNDQCKSFLRAAVGSFDQRLFGRKCGVGEITKEQGREFCDQHHIMGGRTSLVHFTLGLFSGQDLVGVMVLGSHHRQNAGRDVVVIKRLCFASGVQIVGGASKLLAASIKKSKKIGYSKIVTWSDNRWSNGDIYQHIGFTLDREYGPDYSYVCCAKPVCRLSKQSMRKQNTKCPEGMGEVVWNLQNGFARIWDCGKKRWVFNLS